MTPCAFATTMRRLLLYIIPIILIAAGCGAYIYYKATVPSATEVFLASHWQRPLHPQGPPPANYSPLEASLDPADCGKCHQQQWQQWKNSIHHQAMDAGIRWQLQLFSQKQGNQCLDCHAPLAEQKALVALTLDWPAAPSTQLPDYVSPDLARKGVVCAACHVRRHQRFGPPPDQSIKKLMASSGQVHNGFTPEKAFTQSRFCSSCHQFPQDGPRTAGKLREDTYEQWKASTWAKKDVQCQDCHMPDRRHEWKGIHSPQMLKKGITTRLVRHGNHIKASITNSGAGHDLPTYMVPKITLQLLWQSGDHSKVLAQKVIGWKVGIDLTKEYFDHRLPPGKTMTLNAKVPQKATTGNILLVVKVAPEEHYERSFSKSLETLATTLSPNTLTLLKTAYQQARASRYQFVAQRLLLKDKRQNPVTGHPPKSDR